MPLSTHQSCGADVRQLHAGVGHVVQSLEKLWVLTSPLSGMCASLVLPVAEGPGTGANVDVLQVVLDHVPGKTCTAYTV